MEGRPKLPMNTHQQEAYIRSTTVRPFCLPTLSPQEQSRLTFQHHALRAALSGNFLAPCLPTAILDVACGSGAWTAEMGKLFPCAEIVGLDLRLPICPQSSGFQFTEGRIPSVLPFNDARFDYVHQRCLSTVIPTGHWQSVVNELVRVTSPGGWIELMEYGSSYTNAGPATQQFCLWWQEVKALQNIDLKTTEHLGLLLQNAGLAHVEQKTLPIPLWGGRAGEVMSTNLIGMMRHAKASIIALGIGPLTFDQVVGALLKEWQECKTSYHFCAVYGQRGSYSPLLSPALVPSTRDSRLEKCM
jgi:ubiquinone/menaquinone biosynthesis C-methylase UbiE